MAQVKEQQAALAALRADRGARRALITPLLAALAISGDTCYSQAPLVGVGAQDRTLEGMSSLKTARSVAWRRFGLLGALTALGTNSGNTIINWPPTTRLFQPPIWH